MYFPAHRRLSLYQETGQMMVCVDVVSPVKAAVQCAAASRFYP
jgi:hypothetical protein